MDNYTPSEDNNKSPEELMREVDTVSSNPNSPNISSTPEVKEKNKLFFKIAAGVIGLILISGGVVLGARLWDPLWNPFRPSPEKVLSKMISKDVSGNIHTDSNISFIKKGNESGGIFITSSGDMDTSNEENIKSKGVVDIAIESGGIRVSIGLDYLSDGPDSFIKINKVPTIPGLGLDLSILNNQWIINESEGSFDKDILKDVSANNFVIKNELPDEKINNQKAYHYVVGFKEEGIDQLIDKIYDSINDQLSSSMMGEAVGLSELEAAKSQLREMLMGLEIETWISKKDYSLYKIKMNEKELDEDWSLAFDMEFSEVTEPLTIKAPSDYSTMEEIMMALIFGSSLLENSDSPFDMMRRTASDLLPGLNLR